MASGGVGYAQKKKKFIPDNRVRQTNKPRPSNVAPKSAQVSETPSLSAQAEQELKNALALTKLDPPDYATASSRLFKMTRDPRFVSQRMRIKYVLGLMLYEMGMYQVAAFQFVDVIRNADSRYMKQSLQKLSLAADALNDDTLLNYAISKVNIDEFPVASQDMLRFRFGEYYQRKNQWDKAADNFSRVPASSAFYPKAKYLEGLSYVKQNDLNGALKSFSNLVANRADKGITDTDRVAGLMGMARIYYQSHKWDQAIDIYRKIPRDTVLWHDALFESSWAHMRAAQFRSVLSNLHSLHSPFYEDYYLPESILLRGIVYLYICRYDEMEKTLGLFEKIYQPVQNGLEDFTQGNTDPISYFNEVERVIKNFDQLKGDPAARKALKVPFLVSRDIVREGDFKHIYAYIVKIRAEQDIANKMPVSWRRSAVGIYANELLKGRINTSVKLAGEIARSHMVSMRQELSDLFEQYNFARYEMINGKKEQLKKKIQGKGLVSSQVDDNKDRDFYIQNGYEYWPFRGEYWLDEIGNYHFLGTQGCE